MPDFTSGANTGNDLMMYETGVGSVRTIFGNGYERIAQKFVPEVPGAGNDGTNGTRTFFHPDIYGSPLFATDEQGSLIRYAERSIWGEQKADNGAYVALPAGLDENLRFTTYRYDAVIDKYFAHARFYDHRNGRMLAFDPVKTGLNRYLYCEDDPVNQVDPDGESPLGWIVAGTGLLNLGIGTFGSAIHQAMNGEEVNWRAAFGTGVNQAMTSSAEAFNLAETFIPAPLKKPVAAGVNFLAGTVGDALEQYIVNGKVDPWQSAAAGLSNAVTSRIYGDGKFKCIKDAFKTGAKASGADSLIRNGVAYVRDLVKYEKEKNKRYSRQYPDASGYTPYSKKHDPRSNCRSADPFQTGFGYGSARGYQCEVPRESIQQKRPNLLDYAGNVVEDTLTGGLGCAGFYGVDKVVGKLTGSLGKKQKNSFDLYRKEANQGEFKNLEEPMQLKHVKKVAKDAGIGLEGVKVKIDRNTELLGKRFLGHADKKTITLYPDAFSDRETLVKTIGHERMHVYQIDVFGKPTSSDILQEFENAAYSSEEAWWKNYKINKGIKK